MTKRQLIDQILSLNQTAEAEFLSKFRDDELDAYLNHLTAARMPRPWRWRGRAGTYISDASKLLRKEAVAAEPTVETEQSSAQPVAVSAGGGPGEFFEEVRSVMQGRLF
ncbi:MAG: hypothetical protein ABFD92_02865 [Planctomycetaceae bacterium]|nr:hypothetical protein [Planctomycetaceae bacterium]